MYCIYVYIACLGCSLDGTFKYFKRLVELFYLLSEISSSGECSVIPQLTGTQSLSKFPKMSIVDC